MNMPSPTILRAATILNNGIPAGILQETTEGYTFSYQADYLEMEHAEPVSLTLPLQVPSFHSPILVSFFDGLIPEGWLLDITTHTWKVLHWQCQHQTGFPRRDIMKICLSCGKELREENTSQYWHEKCIKAFFGTSSLPEIDLTPEKIMELAKQQVLQQVLTTGVQKKISLHLETSADHTRRLTFIGYPAGYILKPQTEDYPHMPETEFVTMLTARAFGIETVPFGLIPLADHSLAYITRRVDRAWPVTQTPKGLEKIAMEDFCQLSGRMTADKYKGSYEQCGHIISQYSVQPGLDAMEFFTRLVHAYLTGNNDMHLKNFSLLHDRTKGWSLSPAYDLICAAILLPEDKDETALTLHGKKRKLTRHDFLTLSQHMGLPENRVHHILDRGRQKQKEIYTIVANSPLPASMKDAYKTLYDERSRRLVQQA